MKNGSNDTVSFSRPLRGLGHIMGWFPSAEALGYFHSSAAPTFAAKPEMEGLRVEMEGLRVEMSGLHVEMEGLHMEMAGLHSEMEGLQVEVSSLQPEV